MDYSPEHAGELPTADDLIRRMAAEHAELYEQILDTPGFARLFNDLCLLARRTAPLTSTQLLTLLKFPPGRLPELLKTLDEFRPQPSPPQPGAG